MNLPNDPRNEGFDTPAGFTTVLIEPSRTGLNYPLYIKVEDTVDGKSPLTKEGIFVPRNEIERENVINFINNFRSKENMNTINANQYIANENKFVEYSIGQFQQMEEGRKSADPLSFYTNKLQSFMDDRKAANPVEQFSGFEKLRRPADYALAQFFNIGETITDYIPGKEDIMLGGELIGSLPAMAIENLKNKPGRAKVPASLLSNLMGGAAGVTAGASLGRGLASAAYDFANDLVRLTAGIENPTDTEDAGMRALVEMRNSALFTGMAAGLGPLASYFRPIVGKVLGLGADASGMQKLADKYAVPIGISIAATGDMAGSAAKGFGKVIGVFPLVGGIMRDRQLRSVVGATKAIRSQSGLIGDAESFYREQYKLLSKQDRKIFDDDLKNLGFNSLDEAIEAQVRLDAYAPIQHMTDVGAFMTNSAEARYKRFARVNDLLYTNFENIAKEIDVPFIGTSHTKAVGDMLRERIDQYKITLDNYEKYSPQLNEMEDFIVNVLGGLPEYLDVLQVRGLQKQINKIYGNMKGEFGANFAGSDILAQARKAITTDLNNFAGWKPNLAPETKYMAEKAKKSLLRANSVFAKMSPIYKSQTAKKFKLVDENLFSPGPDLPGWNYADEMYNIVMSKGITPMAVKDVKELIGDQAFASVTRTWLDQGFKQSLRRNDPIDLMVDVPSSTGAPSKRIMVTDFAVDPEALLKNIGYNEPGFEAMIDAAGLNGQVVKKNIADLVDLVKRIENQSVGNPFQLVKRRLALGGLRSGIKTFSFGTAAQVGGAGAGAAVFGPAPIIAGLLARYTADFLSSPDVLKRYSQIIDDKASLAVKRAAYGNIIRDFYKQISTGERLEEFPDEYKTYQGVMEDPGGFTDWLFGTGFDSAMSGAGEPGATKAYNDKRYGGASGTNLSSIITSEVDESDLDKTISSTDVKNPDVSSVEIPEIPNMGDENIIANIPQAAGVNPVPTAPLNRDQRVALASGDLDEAIALGGNV